MLQALKPSPLTTIPATKEGQNTLTIDGRTFRVTRLRSTIHANRNNYAPVGPLTEAQKKKLLTQKRKDTVNLGKKLHSYSAEKQERKLYERVYKRKQQELRRERGLSPRAAVRVEVTPEDLEQERNDVIEMVAWFDNWQPDPKLLEKA